MKISNRALNSFLSRNGTFNERRTSNALKAGLFAILLGKSQPGWSLLKLVDHAKESFIRGLVSLPGFPNDIPVKTLSLTNVFGFPVLMRCTFGYSGPDKPSSRWVLLRRKTTLCYWVLNAPTNHKNSL